MAISSWICISGMACFIYINHSFWSYRPLMLVNLLKTVGIYVSGVSYVILLHRFAVRAFVHLECIRLPQIKTLRPNRDRIEPLLLLSLSLFCTPVISILTNGTRVYSDGLKSLASSSVISSWSDTTDPTVHQTKFIVFACFRGICAFLQPLYESPYRDCSDIRGQTLLHRQA